MAYQSLYRRYRPQKFAEIKGQPHVVAALQNAVVKDEVGHAYLFHGPRGTGKTTSARVLAKALNCENRGDDGEPCGECESCLAIEQGRSFDLHELDAASNNGVDAMRELLTRVNLGTPGRAKVYILDEVHMLTPGAENALLKTLEEPPSHVTWVLATTEPHKVVPTIRSRCQVFELNLLGAEEMEAHIRWVIDDAGLDVDDAAIDHVIGAGGGSVRDTLSALDGVVAAGGVIEVDSSTETLLGALADRDAAAALSAVVDATGRGTDPRRIGENAVSGLRDAFLVAMGSPPPTLAGGARRRAEALAARFSPAAMTRALEMIGTTLVEMRQAPDPRVALEVTLVRICRIGGDQSLDALTQRIEQLEKRLASGAGQPSPPPAPVVPSAAPASAPVAAADARPVVPDVDTPSGADQSASPSRDVGPAAAARRALNQQRSGTPREAAPASSVPESTPPPVVPSTVPRSASAPSESPADFAPTSPGEVVDMAVRTLGMSKDDVIARANEILGPKVPGVPRSPADLRRLWQVLNQTDPVVDEPETTPPSDPVDEVDLNDLVDAPAHTDQLLEQLAQAFPGAELLPTEQDQQHD